METSDTQTKKPSAFEKLVKSMKKVRKCDLKFLTHNKLSILGKPHTIEISSPLQYLTFKEEKKKLVASAKQRCNYFLLPKYGKLSIWIFASLPD